MGNFELCFQAIEPNSKIVNNINKKKKIQIFIN